MGIQWSHLYNSEARKFQVALVAAIAVLGSAVVDGQITDTEWIQAAFAFVSAFLVYTTSNTPQN